MLDAKIVNGQLIDGTGAKAYRGDIGIRDGRIVAVGTVNEPAKETIDASGLVVTPGFVDVHTHYDAQVFWDPFLSPSCYHGVTTVVGGNCGFSIAPLGPDSLEYIGPMLARVEGMPLATLQAGVPWDWKTFGEYLSKLEGNLGINAGFMVGHSAVRRAVMGKRAVGHPATEDEIAKMRELVRASIREGALGFSTTVSRSHNDADGNPVPSRHATKAEILALAGVCREFEGTSLELLPDLDFRQDTIDLMTDFSLAGQRPVNWNVLAVSTDSPEEAKEAERKLAVSDYARGKGAKIVALTLPARANMRLNFWSGFVFDSLPGWDALFRLPPEQRLEKLKDPTYRQFLDERAHSPEAGFTRFLAHWPVYVVSETFAPENKRFEGKSIGELAQELGKTPFDTLLDIVVADGLKTSLFLAIGKTDKSSTALRAKLWQDPRTVVGASDAGAHLDLLDTFAFSTRMLQIGVREHQVISLEDAVHQLTQVPAELIGLRERGVLKPGWHADIVIFDPETVGLGEVYTKFDLPGSEGRLYADAIGINRVLVNGRTIVKDGVHTGAKPGTVLRPGRDTYTNKIPLVA